LKDEFIEPGESIHDLILWSLPAFATEMVWLRLNLRILSGGVEWRELADQNRSGTCERAKGTPIMSVHAIATGTSSRPERKEETIRVEALKKKTVEMIRKLEERRAILKEFPDAKLDEPVYSISEQSR
jgi:hypothetical protein